MALKRGSKAGKKQEEESLVSPSKQELNNVAIVQQTQDSEPPTETTQPVNRRAVNMEQNKMDTATSIMEFSSDLATAEAPPPIPAGEYPATIVKAELKDSKAGNRYLALMFRIEPESYPADFQDGNPEGETFAFNRVVLADTAQGRWRVRKFCEAVGAPLSSKIDPNDFMGLTATVGIVHSTWEGENRAEIAKVIAA